MDQRQSTVEQHIGLSRRSHIPILGPYLEQIKLSRVVYCFGPMDHKLRGRVVRFPQLSPVFLGRLPVFTTIYGSLAPDHVHVMYHCTYKIYSFLPSKFPIQQCTLQH